MGGGENLKLLENCPKQLVSKFLHCAADSVCGIKHSGYNTFSQHYSLEDWWSAQEAWSEFMKEAVKSNYNKDDMLSKLDSLSSEQREIACDVISVRRDQVRHHLLQNMTSISSSHLKDFDWKLNLVMSSDKLSSVQEPLMSLHLDVTNPQGDQCQNVSVELNKDDLQKVVASLEAANKAVLQLKT